jgi:hypothetical protein
LLTIACGLIAWTVVAQPDAGIVLGLVERDLTGDGKPEILRVVAVRTALDNLDMTFTIESAGQTIFRFTLDPWSRTVGFDASRRIITAEEQRARLKDFRRGFFADGKFQRPAEFVESLRAMAPGRVAEIPDVIARDHQAGDTRDASEIWEGILNSPVTIFTFSPGKDAVLAIGWNARAGRFYRLLECC